MSLITRFKRDYLNYLLSIITPAIINALSIPLFKRWLGAEKYGHFSLMFNTLLLCATFLTGWITQSIIRFFPVSNNKINFFEKSFQISGLTLVTSAPFIFFSVLYFENDFLLSIIATLSIIAIGFQFSATALSQSTFLSRKTISSELIRSLSFISGSIFFLMLMNEGKYLYSLVTAIFVSYLLSFIYLAYQINKALKLRSDNNNQKETNDKKLFKNFISYGVPMSIWLVFTYLLSIVDKYFIIQSFGGEVQGNYQALFDFLSKGISVLASPVLIALLPLLADAYQNKKNEEIKKLLTRIVLFEIAILCLTLIVYWWFGVDILFDLIKIPFNYEYKISGMLIIMGSFIWQIAMVAHKKYELEFKTMHLVFMLAFAFIVQLLLYLFFASNKNQLLYPMGYLIAAFTYLILVSISQIKKIRFN